MKLILSTSNIMNGGPSVIRRPTVEKSNIELINGLRSNFVASLQLASDGSNPRFFDSHCSSRPPYASWTSQDGDTIYVPAIDTSISGLAEERTQYDITVKLFYLPGIPASRRGTHTKEAISLVLKELRVESIDLLIVSFPNISFDAEDDEEVSESGSETDEMETMIQTWRTLESLHADGQVVQLGVAEFGSERLEKFLPQTRVRPSVDQINVRDCCVVPKSLILFAKQEKIELLTHNDCTDILPRGTTRELLSTGVKGAGILAAPGESAGEGLHGDVEPQWVIKYTAVVKDRGVIENKGYFADAEVGSCIPMR